MSAASKTRTNLSCTLIPLKNTAMLIPSSAIAEVILQKQIQGADSAAPWLAGTILWNDKELPVINPESLDTNQSQTRFDTKNIVVIIRNPDPTQTLSHIGILTQQSPSVLQATQHNLGADTAPLRAIRFALSYVQIDQQAAYIPDIPAIFQYIAQQAPVSSK